MKPVSTQTISRFVWISFVTSNGSHVLIGSGPRYFDRGQQPERHLQSIQQQGDDEVGIGDGLRARAHPTLLSLERREVRDQVVDIRRSSGSCRSRRHHRLPARGVRRAGDDVLSWVRIDSRM